MTESENSDLESNLRSSHLLTSTPYAKHVTFAVENSDSDRLAVVNSDSSEVVHVPSVTEESFSEITPILENGHGSQTDGIVEEYESLMPNDEDAQNPSGILKSHHPVRECGGGDASQQPSGRSQVTRTRQTQGTRNKEGTCDYLLCVFWFRAILQA